MTFEEFFIKKRIDLTLLQNSELALFAELQIHFKQMGEKSFDHTKKYWFNQLRRRFPVPVEVKPEKVIIENQLAEQTIAESLTEITTSIHSVGFKPRFKANMVSKPEEETFQAQKAILTVEEKPADELTKAVGFKPRFKASIINKSAEETVESKNDFTDKTIP